ncbi:uncharacterized protein si:dkey-24l11.2 [Oncorhynchus kisutch]|uniref:Nucleoporin NUP42 n=1 Tax=Oncorhynchus kisutch TaxID=8019 RepID=A0A8C7D7Q4_ONCKI|nr:uncharacterized protein LOC109867138 [Oncorhynchus kisutch]
MERSPVNSVEVSPESNGDSVSLCHNEEENRNQPAHGGPQVQLCRFYSQGRHCNFGRKCRFLHQRGDSTTLTQGTVDNWTNQRSQQEIQRGTGPHSHPGITPQNPVVDSHGDVGHRLPSKPRAAPTRVERANNRRPCRYFLSGCCTMEDRCHYWHPPQFPLVDDQPVGDGGRPRVPHAPPPSALQVVKLSDLTDNITKQLRDTEIKQLIKRFPKEQLIVQERSDGQVTFYRATVQPTDPDWPFDLKDVDIMVSFPKKYPQEVFTLDIPLDQDLPSVMGRYVEQASLEWLQAKHATNQLMGKVELLFRPFLRWLDRSMERLFTEGARQLKKDMEIAKAGIQFVPYQQLQATVCKEPAADDMPDPVLHTATDEESREGEDEEWKKLLYPGCDNDDDDDGGVSDEEDQGKVENIKLSEPRRGTEVKLLGLRLGEGTATVVATQVTVCLQCSRCKVTADLTLNGRNPCTAQCEKCNAGISAAFRPSILHHYSDVLGYLDLGTAAPVDLVLQDCDFVIVCLNCSKEGPVKNLLYGQSKEFNCQHCHSKLSILVDSTRFQYIPPRKEKTGHSDSSLTYRRNIRDPAIQMGKPLPEKGSCKHYKQSHRWLRFSCCGRAYPCDVCHDEDQDHPMELATRMICGHCCKEQPYSNGKPCVSCGGMMTRGAYTSHWEGGLGCRSKVKMSRNDKHKYANTNKTISRKAASEKK